MEHERWILTRASNVLDVVKKRFADGPFREACEGEAPDRVIDIVPLADAWAIGERGSYVMRTELLSERLAPAEPIEAPSLAPAHRLAYVIDPEKQTNLDGATGIVTKCFPIDNRARTAQLSCSSAKAFGPNVGEPLVGGRWAPRMFRYEMTIRTELKLTLFGPRRDDGFRGPVLDVRNESLVLVRYSLVTPRGTYVYRGDELRIPCDEYAIEWKRMIKAFVEHIRVEMNERTSWEHVTPKTLVDAE